MSKELLMAGTGMAGMPFLGSAKRLGYALAIGSFLLRVTYYALVTPLGLALRLIHDPLARRWRPEHASYWKKPR